MLYSESCLRKLIGGRGVKGMDGDAKFKDELNRPYEQVIHHYKWSVIKQIPKNIDQSTSLQALERIDEKGALMKLYDNLILVRKAVTERERVAHKKFEKDEIIFADLTTEINQIITEVGYVLEGFQLTRPCDEASPSLIRHENSEDETARKRKNWLIFHDYIVLVEYTYDVMMYLEKKHCGSA
ncbi:hypothetical protein V9T40_006563 [Parthenolecanium corni]|uniref:Uncharacterized protein n=1 Tax=Parthenolecanium corni TaxID=536013 RepID=A0AAN9TL16_9HEMI